MNARITVQVTPDQAGAASLACGWLAVQLLAVVADMPANAEPPATDARALATQLSFTLDAEADRLSAVDRASP